MRLLLLGLLPLAGCGLSWGPPDAPTSEAGLLMSTSNAFILLDSVAMSDDGENFFAVIDGTTWCSFVSDDGYMEMDTTADQAVDVQDTYAYTPLVVTDNGLEYINESGVTHDYWRLPGVTAARFRAHGSGAVALTFAGPMGGRLGWFDGEAETSSVVVGMCSAIDLDREGDVAWLACESGLVRATPDEAVELDAVRKATHVAWSDAAAMAVVVAGDQRTLAAVDADGAALWTSTLADPVLDLVAIAGRPLFAALLRGEEESEVVLLSADTGEIVDRLATDGTRIRAAHDVARIVIHGGSTTGVYDVK